MRNLVIAAIATCATGTLTAHGAVLQALSNPVAEGSIVTSAGNNSRADWASVTPYATDPYEGVASDWSVLYVAHDTTNFYLRYGMNSVSNGGGWLDGNQYVYFDVDQDRASGFIGGGSQFPVGADYMMVGASVFSFTGGASQTGWSWGWVGSVVYDDYPSHDHELTLPKSYLGSPMAFDFVLLAGNGDIGEDYYPNTANAGAAGGFFTYSVPEPATLATASLAGLMLLGRRRRG